MSKTVRTGARANKRASAASRPPAAATSTRKADEQRKRSDAHSSVEATGGNVPSTLDPDLTEPAENIDAELAEIDRERHEPPDEALLPEEQIYEDIERAVERLPADVPVDKADRTDERVERPPSPPKID